MPQPMTEPLAGLIRRFTDYLPTLAAGLLVLGLGFAVGWLAKRALVRILVWLRLDRLAGRVGWRSAFGKGDFRAALYDLVGTLTFVLVVLVFLDNALTIWGLAILSRMIDNFVVALPRLALAALIVVAGIAIAGAASERAEAALGAEGRPPRGGGGTRPVGARLRTPDRPLRLRDRLRGDGPRLRAVRRPRLGARDPARLGGAAREEEAQAGVRALALQHGGAGRAGGGQGDRKNPSRPSSRPAAWTGSSVRWRHPGAGYHRRYRIPRRRIRLSRRRVHSGVEGSVERPVHAEDPLQIGPAVAGVDERAGGSRRFSRSASSPSRRVGIKMQGR
jgi:hypothetical protein